MGFIKLISLSENIAIDPWELAVLNSLKFNPALENKILKSDLFCCYFEINSFIGFSIRNNKKTSLKKLKEFIQNEIGELSFDKITFLITFIGEGITINKSTVEILAMCSLSGPAGNIKLFPNNRVPSMTNISKSLSKA